MLRPVLIVGPLADCVIDKLLTDFPDQFNRCVPEIQYNSQAFMEKCLSDNIFIDYRKKGNTFECITMAALKESFSKVSDICLLILINLERKEAKCGKNLKKLLGTFEGKILWKFCEY